MCCFLAAAEPLCNRPPGPGCLACRRLPRRAVGPPPGARLQTPRSRRCCAGPSCAEPSGASGSGAEPSSRSSRKSAIGQLGRPSPHGNEPRQAAVGNFNLGQLWRRARTHTNVHTHTHTHTWRHTRACAHTRLRCARQVLQSAPHARRLKRSTSTLVLKTTAQPKPQPQTRKRTRNCWRGACGGEQG